ncbi:hypothetical protein F5Y14DRAFT_371523 [Nemania sp. NC0429]|nr:hypothetical protein F5Y14DRAFT_371523 [Nemania sp. NC0429]
MSFGFSVGDFLAVMKLVSEIRKGFVSAPHQLQQISLELRNLENTVRDIDTLSQQEISEDQKKRLEEISRECALILDDAQNLIDKHSSLISEERDAKRHTVRTWRRFRWDPNDVLELRARITSSVTSFNSFLEVLNGNNIAQLMKAQEQQEYSRQHQKILDWLAATDYSDQQSDFIGRRQAGTGQWLLASDEYQRWVKTEKEALFCPGIPGAGKTIISSIVVDDLLDRQRADESIGVCYVFFNFRRNDEQRFSQLVASLLRQLVQTQSTLSESVKLLHGRHERTGTRPSADELLQALYSVVSEYGRVFMVIDALDECQTADDCRGKFISQLLKIVSEREVNVLATSRPIGEIVSRFEGAVTVNIRARDDDIVRYLDGNLSCLPGFVSARVDLWTEIKERIIECVDGMFLLAQLHLNSLKGKSTAKKVRDASKKLAKGSDAYFTAYEESMARINSQLPDQSDLAMRTLMWITFAQRPLTTTELRYALGVELNTNEFDDDNLPDLEDILSVCCGLVTVTVHPKRDIIRLVHYTTQEYFERTGKSWFPEAQDEIAKTCVAYLSFDAFESSISVRSKLKERLSSYPLYQYAGQYWGIHASLASDYQFCLAFLTSDRKAEACAQVLFRRDSRFRKGVTGLHLAAFFGLHQVIGRFADIYGLNVENRSGMTPIIYAIVNGQVAVVELFLEKGVSVESIIERNPLLSHAIDSGHDAVVRLLIEKGANMESRDSAGRTHLSYAAEYADEAIVRSLIEKGADIESRDNEDRTPLSHATAMVENTAIVSLLLKRGAEINSEDRHGQTPLWHACDDLTLQLLREHGARMGRSIESSPMLTR